MDDKKIDKLLSLLEGIGRDLNTLALSATVQERYPSETARTDLRQRYDTLLEAHRTRQQENSAVVSRGAGDDEKHAAADALRKSHADLTAFEKEHGLLVRLVNRGATLANPHG